MNICAYTCEPHDRPHVRNIDPFQLTVIGYTNDFTVIDRFDNRLFVTYNAATPLEAARAYINWVYGQVRTCEWDVEEAGWCETDDFIPAAYAYDYHAGPLGWELVED
jgi:hypothetical protein